MEELKQTVKRYFDLYPNQEKLWATPDKNVFMRKSDAANHAHATKTEFYEFDRKDDLKAELKKGDQDEKNQEMKAEVLANDPSALSYEGKKKLLLGLNKRPENLKKESVEAAYLVLFNELKAEAEANSAAAGDNKTETEANAAGTGDNKTETGE